MRTLKLTLEYDGTRYSGWQAQAHARTVQGELQRAVERDDDEEEWELIDDDKLPRLVGRAPRAGLHSPQHLRAENE